MLRAVASSPLFAEGEVVQRRVLGKQLAFATLKCDDRSGLLEVLLTLSRLARADRETPTGWLTYNYSLPEQVAFIAENFVRAEGRAHLKDEVTGAWLPFPVREIFKNMHL